MTPQDFTYGQAVTILEGEYEGVVGQIIGHEWNEERRVWLYFVGVDSIKFGPYTRNQLG